MRVCVVCHEASLTGAPRIGFDIALFLAKSNDVKLLVKKDGPLIDFAQYATLKPAYRCLDTNHEICDLTYRERVDHAIGVLGEVKPDLVYVNSVGSGEWCEAAARVDIPVALHTHETRDSLPSLLSSVCAPNILQFTGLLVGASQQAIDDIQSLTGTNVGRRLNFGIFVDSDTILSQSELAVEAPRNARGDALEDGARRHVVAMCGLAQPRKGADIFFDLAVRLPQFDFVWIGPWAPPETPLNDAPYARFESLKLANFFATGLTENPYAHLRTIDVLVLTSREDPNPLVVAEALVLGKKVVAFSDTGASVAMASRFGYALNGKPDVDRCAMVLPKIIESPWRPPDAAEVRREVDGATKLEKLREVLEQFASGVTKPATAQGESRIA